MSRETASVQVLDTKLQALPWLWPGFRAPAPGTARLDSLTDRLKRFQGRLRPLTERILARGEILKALEVEASRNGEPRIRFLA